MSARETPSARRLPRPSPDSRRDGTPGPARTDPPVPVSALNVADDAYGRLCAEFYDLDKPAPPPAELDAWLKACRRANGPVLEGMCGSGRFLIPLLQAGIDIEGVDASRPMLDACARRAATAGLRPGLHLQRIEDLDLGRRYAMIFIAAGSFALIVDRTAEALRRLHAHLVDGGQLLLDLDLHVDGHGSGQRTVDAVDGRTLHLSWTRRDDERPDVALVECRYQRVLHGEKEAEEVEVLRLRQRTLRDLGEDLERAGFRDVSVDAGPNGWVVGALADHRPAAPPRTP